MDKCYLCESQENILTHFLDWHPGNNSPGNRLLLCRRCHIELHKVGYLSLRELESIREGYKVGWAALEEWRKRIVEQPQANGKTAA